MKVAILQPGHAPEELHHRHGDYDDMNKALIGFSREDADTYDVCHNEFPTAPEDYDLYIVTGSPAGVYEDHAWIPRLEDFIRNAYRLGARFVGLCFGHQIIAQAMGGKVIKSEKGYGIGVMDYALAYPPYNNANISLCAWHQDQVIHAPKLAERILTSDFCPNAGFLYEQQAITFQPHPEFTRDFLKDLVNIRVGDTITSAQARQALESVKSRDTDTPIIQSLISEFLFVGTAATLSPAPISDHRAASG